MAYVHTATAKILEHSGTIQEGYCIVVHSGGWMYSRIIVFSVPFNPRAEYVRALQYYRSSWQKIYCRITVFCILPVRIRFEILYVF